MKIVRIKKRHKNMAEVRSYVFNEAKIKGKGLKFVFIDAGGKPCDTMCVPHDEMGRGIVTARGIKSKFVAGQVFDLISFKWESDKDRSLRESAETQMSLI